MTELFRPDGHLSDEGLQALVGGELDELQRLEAAEHLGFCQPCMQRYLALLTGDVLEAPPHDLQLPVARGIRAKLASRTFRRYATAAVAAVLTLTLWGAGVFEWMSPEKLPQLTRPPQWQQTQPPEKPEPLRENPLTKGLETVFSAVNQAVDELSHKMNPDPLTKSEPMRGEKSHDQK